MFLPFGDLAVPECIINSELHENIEMENYVLQEHGRPPYAVLLGQVHKNLNQEAVQYENATQQNLHVGFDLNFRVEVNLLE